MTLLQMRYFLMVARCLSYTKAAQALFVSESSVSKQIVVMENELNMNLFERNHHSVKLTPAGLILKDEFTGIMDEMESAINKAHEVNVPENRFLNIGIMPFMDLNEIVPEFVSDFSKQYGSYDVKIESYPLRELIYRLNNSYLDAIFVRAFDEINGKLLNRIPISRSKPFVYYSDSIFNKNKSILNIRDFDGTSAVFLALDTNSLPDNSKKLEIYDNYGFFPGTINYVKTWEGLLAKVRGGFGVTVAGSSFMIKQDAYIKKFKIENCKIATGSDMIWRCENDNLCLLNMVEGITKYLKSNSAKTA